MDNKRLDLFYKILELCSQFGEYDFDFDLRYIEDSEVNDCKFKLCMLLLVQKTQEQDKAFKEFEESYKNLPKEKQEYIREYLRKIFEKQDKNNKEKEKRL